MANGVTIEDALDYCLANPDGLSSEDLVSKFPQYREELQPLLTLGASIQSVTPPPVSADRRAAMKERLMSAAAAQQPTPATPLTQIRQSARPATPWLKGLGKTWLQRPLWAVAAVAAVLMAFLWWGSASALPDNPLYKVKLAGEGLQTGFGHSPGDEVRTHVTLANNRLYDLRTMQTQGKLAQSGGAFTSYSDHLKSGNTIWKQTIGTERVDLARLLYTCSLAGQQTFQSFKGTTNSLPLSIQTSIQDITTTLDDLNTNTSQALRIAGIDPAEAIKNAPEGLVLTPIITPGTPTAIVAAQGSATRNVGSTPSAVANATSATAISGAGTQTPGTIAGQPTLSIINTRSSAEATETGAAVTSTFGSPSPEASSTLVYLTNTVIAQTGTPPTPSTQSTPPTLEPSATAMEDHTTQTVPPSTRTVRPTQATTVVPTTTSTRPSGTPLTPTTQPSGVPVPPTPSSRPTNVPESTHTPSTPTSKPASTNTTIPSPSVGVCNLEVISVSLSCTQASCASWSAGVRNSGNISAKVGWIAELQINRGSGFQTVDVQRGTIEIAQGNLSSVTGTFCYSFPPDANNAKVRFAIDNNGSICNAPQGNSQAISPCAAPSPTLISSPTSHPTIIPSPTTRPTNTPRVQPTSSPRPHPTGEPTKTPKSKLDTPQPLPQPTSTARPRPEETREPTEEPEHESTRTPRPTRTPTP